MSTLTDANPQLKALTEAGVSIWLDQLGRSLVAGGELKRMVEQESLRGVTSNPVDLREVDSRHLRLRRRDRGAGPRGQEAPRRSTTHSPSPTCRRPVTCSPRCTRRTDGRDGFVSLEVAPDLARDTDGTLASAREYWRAVNRTNVMIKIPGTPEGVGAIEQAIYEGININVTLLFSVENYEAVAEAYIRGLERRHEEGRSLDVNSVASFFVSRVDTLVDKQLDAIGGPEAAQLKGTAALANARAAYARFMKIFSGERWDKLASAGAAVPAAAVGLDRRQEPGLPGHALCRSADRALHRQHDAAGDAATPSPTTARSPARPLGSIRAPSWTHCTPSGSTWLR